MFAILWTDDAFDQMARILQDEPGRRAEFVTALREISDRLDRDPAGEGESRGGNRRVLFAKPLTVYYELDLPLIVEVTRVILFG